MKFKKSHHLPNNIIFLKNNIFPIFISIFVFATFIYILSFGIIYLENFLKWFIEILKIKQVLKISFLQNDRIYSLLAHFIYLYIAFSFCLDYYSFLKKSFIKIGIFQETLYIIEYNLFSNKIYKINYFRTNSIITLNTSLIRKLLSLESFSVYKDNQIFSSTFFSSSKNKYFLQVFHKN